jgi:hypothetical protein
LCPGAETFMEDLGLLWIPAGFALIFFSVAAPFLTI